MADLILPFLSSVIKIRELIVGIVSMIPLIELKGAIPIGEGLNLPVWESALIAYLGSTLVVIPVFFLLIPVFRLLKKIPFIKKLVEKLEASFEKRARKMAEKAGGDCDKQQRKMLIKGLFIFVSIPIPLTGVWTGTALAVFLNMKFRDSVLPLALGNLLAGAQITLLTYLFHDYVNYIIDGILVIAAVMLIVTIVKIAVSKPKEADASDKKS